MLVVQTVNMNLKESIIILLSTSMKHLVGPIFLLLSELVFAEEIKVRMDLIRSKMGLYFTMIDGHW